MTCEAHVSGNEASKETHLTTHLGVKTLTWVCQPLFGPSIFTEVLKPFNSQAWCVLVLAVCNNTAASPTDPGCSFSSWSFALIANDKPSCIKIVSGLHSSWSTCEYIWRFTSYIFLSFVQINIFEASQVLMSKPLFWSMCMVFSEPQIQKLKKRIGKT